MLLLLNAVGAAIFFDGATATTIASIPISIAIALKMKSWVSKGDNDSHPNKGKYSFWVDYEAVYNNTLLQQHLSKSVSAHLRHVMNSSLSSKDKETAINNLNTFLSISSKEDGFRGYALFNLLTLLKNKETAKKLYDLPSCWLTPSSFRDKPKDVDIPVFESISDLQVAHPEAFPAPDDMTFPSTEKNEAQRDSHSIYDEHPNILKQMEELPREHRSPSLNHILDNRLPELIHLVQNNTLDEAAQGTLTRTLESVTAQFNNEICSYTLLSRNVNEEVEAKGQTINKILHNNADFHTKGSLL